MSLLSCIDCKYFASNEDGTCASLLMPSEREDLMQGQCRRRPPTVGRFRGENKDLVYDYGQWPLVLSCDWCGKLKPWRKKLRKTSAPHALTLAPDEPTAGVLKKESGDDSVRV